MTPAEWRAGVSLSLIFALRMLGLFLILPVFAVHARSIPGGDDSFFVGLAIGAYGLTQALLQIAFGAASDRFGRKPVIVFGLLLFVAGSVVAALASDIYTVIAGRVIQGAGAISAAVTALAADLTREQHRTKVMAMIGSGIALVFALSMVAAPLLYRDRHGGHFLAHRHPCAGGHGAHLLGGAGRAARAARDRRDIRRYFSR
jgi:MFS family permease